MASNSDNNRIRESGLSTLTQWIPDELWLAGIALLAVFGVLFFSYSMLESIRYREWFEARTHGVFVLILLSVLSALAFFAYLSLRFG